MKKTVRFIAPALVLVIALMLAPLSFGQVIDNPAKPKAANAGRVVAPQEILSISDEGTSDYFFKWPAELRIGPNGSLLVTDDGQILQFDANGRLLRNLFKKGQGPGEMENPGPCVATEKEFIAFPWGGRKKLVVFDATGKFVREVPVLEEDRTFLTFLHYLDGTAYFEAGGFPRTTGDPDFVDNPRTITAVSDPGGAVRKLTTFMTRAWAVTAGGSSGMFDVCRLNAVPFEGRLLALTHTEGYLIKIYDPAADKVLRQFRRPYARVKGEPLTEREKKGGLFLNGKHYTRPERDFENDVKNVLARDNEIWAVTSTKDKAKGVLVDVFDGGGVYRDCFWLRLPEPALGSLFSPGQSALAGEFLWVVERAEDETSVIKKYRVVI